MANSIFNEVRIEEIKRIIQTYPLATIVTTNSQGLYATHIPVMLEGDEILFGHLAKENPLYRDAAEQQQVLCIFNAEDAYVSANDYPSKFEDHKKVPTWNYQVVHAHGQIQFLTDQQSKLAALGQLTKKMEQQVNADQAWKMSDAPKDYLIQMLEDIVVFKIKITQLQAISKLSQNKQPRDFDGVVDGMRRRGHDGIVRSMLGLNFHA